MRARTLFIGTLGFSLIVHALILFGPALSLPQVDGSTEHYRVRLAEKLPHTPPPVPSAETTKTVLQDKPKSEILETKEEQVIPQDKGVDNPQSNEQQDPTVEEKNTLRQPAFDHQTSWSSQGTVPNLQPEQPSDYQRVLDELRRRLQDSLSYPEAARRKGIEGSVLIALTMTAEGYAREMIVSQSSGSRLLDRAALKALSEILPHPHPPDTSLHFTIPVTYRLTESE